MTKTTKRRRQAALRQTQTYRMKIRQSLLHTSRIEHLVKAKVAKLEEEEQSITECLQFMQEDINE